MLLLLCYLSFCTAMMVRMVSVIYLPPPCAIIHVCTSSATMYRRVLPSIAGLPAVLVVLLFSAIVYYLKYLFLSFSISSVVLLMLKPLSIRLSFLSYL